MYSFTHYNHKPGEKQGHVLVPMISDTFLSMRGAFSLRRCQEHSDEAICAQLAERPRLLTSNRLCDILNSNFGKGARRCRH